ncbi:MAG: enolase [Candidatus Parcubacteria bacterium]|nr:MAG: enolase [Candidatus Parcubacteria bacterium]
MRIDNIKVNKILDSRGEWTIEVEVESEGIKGKASIPSGKSIGSHEVVCFDCEKIENNLGNFLKDIRYKDFQRIEELDKFIIERAGKKKEKIGGNFSLGISISFARILAKKNGLELFEYLDREFIEIKESIFTKIPRLILNIIGGGVHSFNNLDFQEYWLITRANSDFTDGYFTDREGKDRNQEQSVLGPNKSIYFEVLISQIIEVINQLEKKLPKPLGRNDEGAFCTNFSDNYEPFIYLNQFKENFELGADIAANQITKIVNWKNIYEKLKLLGIKYLEDPCKEDEFEKFAELREQGFKIIGDDLTVTNIERLKSALEKKSVDGVIVKPNQIGTITETFEFVRLAKENNLFTIFSHRSGETNDHWIIDLGIALRADYFKIGVPLQGERIAKYNRLLEIYRNIK